MTYKPRSDEDPTLPVPAVVLCFSGGLDSTILLYDLLAGGHKVFALSIDYGSRHGVRELEAASAIAADAKQRYVVNFRHETIDLASLRGILGASSLMDPNAKIPHGHYTDVSQRSTVVPNRNMILLAIAVGWAQSLRAELVAYAAHYGDRAIYPDCRDDFVAKMRSAVYASTENAVRISAPFLNMMKHDIVKLTHRLARAGVSVPLAKTWSCYEGGLRHCGKCGTCVERREAFIRADVNDPTEYDGA